MEQGEKYLNGNVSMGVLGQRKIAIFQNTKKKPGSREPDYNITVRDEKKDGMTYLKNVGALWITEKKATSTNKQQYPKSVPVSNGGGFI